MADLFMRAQGDRPASAVANGKPLQVDLMTENGVIRVTLDVDGEFEVLIGVPDGKYGLTRTFRVLDGNVDKRTRNVRLDDLGDVPALRGRHRSRGHVATPAATTEAKPETKPKAEAKLTVASFSVGNVVERETDKGKVVGTGDDAVGAYVEIEWRDAGYESLYNNDLSGIKIVMETTAFHEGTALLVGIDPTPVEGPRFEWRVPPDIDDPPSGAIDLAREAIDALVEQVTG